MSDKKTSPGVALVFGGSRGIGAAATRRLARDGFAVATLSLALHLGYTTGAGLRLNGGLSL